MLAELQNVEAETRRISAVARERSVEDQRKIPAIPTAPAFTPPISSMKPLFASSPLIEPKPSIARKPADVFAASGAIGAVSKPFAPFVAES